MNEIPEGGLNPVPDFYKGLTNSPLGEITGGAKRIDRDYIVLDHTEIVKLEVPELNGGIPGYTSVTNKHNIGSGQVFVFYYVESDEGAGITGIVGGESPYFNGYINIGAVKVIGDSYKVEAWNQNVGLGIQTIVLRVDIYQLK